MTASPTEEYVRAAATRLGGSLGARLLGVYAHGSLVLGDFAPERSDVDLLAVAAAPVSAPEKERIAAELSEAALPCPAAGGLEFHLVDRSSILPELDAPRFELHVATTPGARDRVVDGAKRPGDPDLVLHFAVLRDHGRGVHDAPPARELFPRMSRAGILTSLGNELRWALEHASASYGVLNACRALRVVEEGVFCSKTAAGEWALQRAGPARPPVVEAALRHRHGLAEAHPPADDAAAFIRRALFLIESVSEQAEGSDRRPT